jgi:hypothetical protein
MPLSARELAQRIAARSGGESDTLFERVRHWTREGLLNVDGELNPGTGRNREYPESELGKARVLNALAELGIGLKTMRRATRFLSNHIVSSFGEIEMATMLIVAKRDDGEYAIETYIADNNSKSADVNVALSKEYSCAIVLNLTRLFAP